MRRTEVLVVLVVAVVAAFFGWSLLSPAEIGRNARSASLAIGTPEPVCTGWERTDIVTVPTTPVAEVIVPTPWGSSPGFATPEPVLSMNLSFTTFPPRACDEIHSHARGANIIYVLSGTIEYLTAENPADGVVAYHQPGGSGAGVAVSANTWLSVTAGEWITEKDGGYWHAIRNSGDTEAVVAYAVYSSPYSGESMCFGGCRTRGP